MAWKKQDWLLTLDKIYKSAVALFTGNWQKYCSRKEDGRSVVWQNCISQLFQLNWNTEHLGAYQIMHGPLINTYKAGYQLWPSTVHPLAKWLWLKTHVNCFLIADTVLRQSQNAELGFDWHFLKNMQQTWDVIQMAASVLNVKYLDTFWTRNNFFDNDFCKDWYHISFLMMYIVCH